MIEVAEGGAKCVFLPNYKIPLMLQKSDGGFGYDSTDMAALKYRIDHLGASRVVYITDFSQGDHFHMIFDAGKMIGWLEDKQQLEHIGFGTVMGEDGKRFKTRSGDTVRLVDLLDEAVTRMEASLYERIDEGKAVITKEDVPKVAATMGYGAVKYFDLRRNPTTNYKFSYDKMLDTKGNTAIYLLYAHARLESIISRGKADHNIDVDSLIANKKVSISIGHQSERILVLHLQMFADMIEEVLKDLYPYRVCDFLYSLSNAVSDFITQCKVLHSAEMESRLLLCRASAVVMRQCFVLLGIGIVDRI
jgi:arginyl-tRNA synthetase